VSGLSFGRVVERQCIIASVSYFNQRTESQENRRRGNIWSRRNSNPMGEKFDTAYLPLTTHYWHAKGRVVILFSSMGRSGVWLLAP
jgi:hypothetical protein